MKRLIFLACAVLLMCAGFGAVLEAADNDQGNGTLKVVIGGMKSEKGDIKIALFNSKESFEGKAPAFRSVRVEIKQGLCECEFSGIPFGVYALSAYHDENGNGKLDKNAMGQPKERYGFSNNARGTFGPPAYDQTKFIFEKSGMNIQISVE